MKLYFAPGACSLAPHIALREAGLAFDLEQVDLAAKKTKGGADFKQINGKGYVPTLQLDDGQVLTEVPVVLQYIGDQKPDSGLVPKPGTSERYRAQEWLNFVTAELHKGFGALFNPAVPDAYRTIAEGAPTHLEEGGVVAFEIGFDQREAVTRLMAGNQFRLVEAASDLGGNDRVLVFAAA